MDWNELIDAVNNIKTPLKYPIDCDKDRIEVGLGNVDDTLGIVTKPTKTITGSIKDIIDEICDNK